MRFDSPAELLDLDVCASVSAWSFWRAASIARSCVPPPDTGTIASFFVETFLSTIAPSRTRYVSAFTRPETSASPSPKLASIDDTLRFEVIGSAVNKIPAACGNTIRWITTAICTRR